jgi:hypothetical protein
MNTSYFGSGVSDLRQQLMWRGKVVVVIVIIGKWCREHGINDDVPR